MGAQDLVAGKQVIHETASPCSVSVRSSVSQKEMAAIRQVHDSDSDADSLGSGGDSIMDDVHDRIQMLNEAARLDDLVNIHLSLSPSQQSPEPALHSQDVILGHCADTRPANSHRDVGCLTAQTTIDDFGELTSMEEGMFKRRKPEIVFQRNNSRSACTKRRRLGMPFRLAITAPLIAAMIAVCIIAVVPMAYMFSHSSNEILHSYSVSVGDQKAILDNVTKIDAIQAHDSALKRIEWSIRWNVVEPADRAVELLEGVVLATAAGRRPPMSWLADEALRELLLEAMDEHSGGRAAALYVAFSSGAFAGASKSNLGAITAFGEPEQNQTFPTVVHVMPASEGNGTLRGYTRNMTPVNRVFYKVQSNLAKTGGKSKLAWSKLHRFDSVFYPEHLRNGSQNVGITATRPVNPCGNYSCFSGVVGADVELSSVNIDCMNEWVRLKKALAGPSYKYDIFENNSAIFIVSHSGLLAGASDSADDNPRLIDARFSANPVVAMTAMALLLKFGTWETALMFAAKEQFTFNKSDVQAGLRPRECNSSTAHGKTDCFKTGLKVVKLDENTSWLAVITLPADAYTSEILRMQGKVEADIKQLTEKAAENREHVLVLVAVLFLIVVVLGCCVGIAISRIVSRPLEALGKMMRQLERLDFSESSTEMLELSTKSGLREINELRSGFFGLFRSMKVFARFVPQTVVRNILLGDECARRLHVRQREVTIMFSDMQNWTSISEKLRQRDLLLVLVLYLSWMTRIVEAFKGVVSEILGDGLLVYFNTPDDLPRHAARACAAALAQQHALRALNNDLGSLGLPKLSIRIGIHTGQVLSGNIGSETKMKFGCMGDAVNLAARLEGLCKFYRVGVIISKNTKDQLPTDAGFVFRRLDLVQVKGRVEPTWIYELIGRVGKPESPMEPISAERLEQARTYERALEAFHGTRFQQCATLAESVLSQRPDDLASEKLLARARARLEQLENHSAARDADTTSSRAVDTWSPVLVLDEK
eukprot:TRINITY_DN8383_c0_g1_i2.p1 TRINITY_DN8383_c0_g1~~TRINITY_DN8383_c0_g1_i2.p1  ORF type:complete len:1013 (-),score=144.77 TRINITY_DN8383_c0_g1_i2:369-3347(-)